MSAGLDGNEFIIAVALPKNDRRNVVMAFRTLGIKMPNITMITANAIAVLICVVGRGASLKQLDRCRPHLWPSSCAKTQPVDKG